MSLPPPPRTGAADADAPSVLLELDGRPVGGLPRSQLLSALEACGEEAELLVLPQPPGPPPAISELLAAEEVDAVTARFRERLRRTIADWILAVTSRPRGEADGPDGHRYTFVTVEQFHDLAKRGHFLEWCQHRNGHFYGLPREAIVAPASGLQGTPRTPGLWAGPPSPEVQVPLRTRSPSLADLLAPVEATPEAPLRFGAHAPKEGVVAPVPSALAFDAERGEDGIALARVPPRQPKSRALVL